MDVLQKEMNDIVQMWNTHVIRMPRGGVGGKPDELYHLPSLQGMNIIIIYCILLLRPV